MRTIEYGYTKALKVYTVTVTEINGKIKGVYQKTGKKFDNVKVDETNATVIYRVNDFGKFYEVEKF